MHKHISQTLLPKLHHMWLLYQSQYVLTKDVNLKKQFNCKVLGLELANVTKRGNTSMYC